MPLKIGGVRRDVQDLGFYGPPKRTKFQIEPTPQWHHVTAQGAASMAIYNLTATKIGGRLVFSCPKCKLPATPAYGAQNRDQLVYLLLCPKCPDILGEWTTREERDSELRGLVAKLNG